MGCKKWSGYTEKVGRVSNVTYFFICDVKYLP